MPTSHLKMAKSSLTFTPNLQTNINTYYIRHACHPIHTKRAIPFSLALGLRRICSANEIFTLRTNELIGYLYKRGYNRYNGQKYLRPTTLQYWTNQNVFALLPPTTQPFVPSHPSFANTFTSLCHPPVTITSLKLHQL